MKSSNNNLSTNSNMSSGGSSSGGTPRFFGNITLEMIDDFLNPISKKKDKEHRHQIKFMPPSSTNGLGLVEKDPTDFNKKEFNNNNNNNNNRNAQSDREKRLENSYLPFSQRESDKNFEYVTHYKKSYERELKESSLVGSMNASFLNESIANEEEERSAVGSSLFQVESVSTMSMAASKKAALMKHAEKLTKLNVEESSIIGDDANKLNKIFENAEQVKDVDEEERKQKHLEELCKTYKQRESFDPRLPITEKKERIINFIASYSFSIIQGGTGCGKTTQVPQYILDAHMKEQKYCNIIVTQPRRIAAISVAKRVCSERGWQLGSLCGYQIGLDRKNVSEDTRITYVTTGVLLQKLIGPAADSNFEKYTHIILDEVHERDLDTDFVLLIIKIKSHRNLKSKIILMSATIDSDLFAKYYAQKTNPNSIDMNERVPLRLVPTIKIDTNPYNVQEFYWEDLVDSRSFLSSTLTTSYKEKLEKIKTNGSYLDKNDYSIFQRSYGYNYRSFNRSIIDKNIKEDNGIHSIKRIKQHMQNMRFNYEEPEMTEEAMSMVINLLKYFDELDLKSSRTNQDNYNDEDLNESDDDNDDKQSVKSKKSDSVVSNKPRIIDGFVETRGSVLIFVPGMQQIQALQELISKELVNRKLNILPLHSDLVLEQQVRVFEKSQPTWRKVIISTSIAESSITVPDIKYVIDFCLTKELYCDPYTNYTHLRLEWASKSSTNQRRGRAGRVSDGICYRLVTKEFYQDLDEYTKPAILREPLSQIILNVKRLKQTGEPRRILSLAIQPPKLSDIERTILLLKEVGALSLKTKNSDGTYSNNSYDGDLTYVGSIMANLPIDVRLSKLILLGHTFGKLKEAIIIAAGLSTKTFFTCYFKSYLESFKAKWTWSEGWMCDCICILNVFNLWESMNQKQLLTTNSEKLKWARKNMIELDRLREVDTLKQELESRLQVFNIRCQREVILNVRRDRRNLNSGGAGGTGGVGTNPYDIDDHDDPVRQNLILKMIIAGAFYPNYFTAQKVDLSEAYKMVSFKDLKNTVQIKNLPNNEGILYHQKICDMFRICSNSIQLHFEDTKAYIEFKSQYEQVPSNVNLSVYLAVQMRLLRLPMRLRRYSPEVTLEKLKKFEQSKHTISNLNITIDKSRLGVLKLNISSRENVNRKLDAKKKGISENPDDSDDRNSQVSDSSTIEAKSAAGSDDEEINFHKMMIPKENTQLDMSKYLSCASILTQTESFVYDSQKNLNTSMSTASNKSSSKVNTRQLTSNRITTSSNSITKFLSDPKYLLPEKVDLGEYIDIYISELIECGHFWAQINDEAHYKTLELIQDKLNRKKPTDSVHASNSSLYDSNGSLSNKYPLKLLSPNNLNMDQLCVTTYKDQNEENAFYRAKILFVNKVEQTADVQFIDFGNKEKKKFNELFELSRELQEYPFQAIECKVANIRISLFKNPNGTWTQGATKKFSTIIDRTRYDNVKMKVICLNDNVAMVKLRGELDHNVYDIGELMASSGYAELIDDDKDGNLIKNKYSSENILYVPTRKSDYITNKPNIASADHDLAFMMYKTKVSTNTTYLSMNDLNNNNNTVALIEKNKLKQKDKLRNSDDEDSVSSVAESYNTETTTNLGYPSQNNDEKSYSGFIDIFGPYSPLEVNYFGMVNVGHSKRSRVERNSINYVTLDDDPFNDCTRLMIASDVNLNANGDTMILRKTTLMPKLPGLSSICCLLFSPNVEFRCDEKKTRYTGALCGLGADDEGAIYTDNDIECTFDVNIDINDITMINAVRLAINLVIGSEDAAKTWTTDDINLKQLQQRACDKLLQVIQRNRKIIEPTFFKRPNRWNQVDEQDLIMPEKETNKQKGTEYYYTFHQAIALNPPH